MLLHLHPTVPYPILKFLWRNIVKSGFDASIFKLINISISPCLFSLVSFQYKMGLGPTVLADHSWWQLSRSPRRITGSIPWSF